MKFTPLALKGAYLIELEPNYDDRGYFARTFCRDEFLERNLQTDFIQTSSSMNLHKGQIRGMHYQVKPYEETKLIRCTQGSLVDVIVDIRPESPTYQESYQVILSSKNHKMLYVPKGFAHGFKTLEDNTEILYMMDTVYHPQSAREISSKPYFEEVTS